MPRIPFFARAALACLVVLQAVKTNAYSLRSSRKLRSEWISTVLGTLIAILEAQALQGDAMA
jgi:hypothetical protein